MSNGSIDHGLSANLRLAFPAPDRDAPIDWEGLLRVATTHTARPVGLTFRGARPVRIAAIAAAACATAALVGVFVVPSFISHQRPSIGQRSLVPPITMANPLAFGQKTTLADAEAKLGTSIALPTTAGMATSDVGAVWVRQDGGGQSTSVAVTLPSAGLILQFDRPVSYPQPPAQMYQTEATQHPSIFSVIDLDGVPALATRQNADQFGQNFGAIEFVVGGTRIAVLGHYDEATLRTFASSLLGAASG